MPENKKLKVTAVRGKGGTDNHSTTLCRGAPGPIQTRVKETELVTTQGLGMF